MRESAAVDILEPAMPFLCFLLISGALLFVYQSLRRRRAEPAAPEEGEPAPMVLGDLTPALAAQIPIMEETRSELQRELRAAGYYRPTAVVEYAAIRTLLTIPPVIAAGVLALFLDDARQATYCWIGGVVLALLGFSLPRIYVAMRAKARGFELERGLPAAVDMLSLCLSAGLNVLTSLDRVVKELYQAFPVLAFELDIVRRQAELRTLDFAWAQFAERTGLANVRNLAVIFGQSETLGADALGTLREYNDSIRTNLRQRAEETANKAPFRVMFPSYLMAIGAAILIVSPTVLEFRAFRQANTLGQYNRESRDKLAEPVAGTAAPTEEPAPIAP
jgi:tight adherence protein C